MRINIEHINKRIFVVFFYLKAGKFNYFHFTGETEDKGKKEEETNQTRLEELEKSLKRAAHVRPWDIGKDGVKTPKGKIINNINLNHNSS